MLSRITFVVTPTPPFRLDLTVWTARRRSGNAVDRWDGHGYRRVLMLHRTSVEIAVEQAGSRLHVCAAGAGRLPPDARLRVTSMLERTLGLRADLTGFHRFARRDRRLRPLVERFRGVKPPRYPSLFEALLNDRSHVFSQVERHSRRPLAPNLRVETNRRWADQDRPRSES